MMIFGTAALLLIAAQALPAPVEIGNWLVAPATSDSCAAVADFGPNLMVGIRESAMGSGEFYFSDDRWKLDGAAQTGRLSWDNWATTTQVTFTARKAASGRWVLAIATDGGFTKNLAGSKRLWLRVPGVGFDDDLDIPEASDVLTGIVTCNEKLP